MPMSDDDPLDWQLGARYPGHDYRVFTTGFVDARNPRTGATKRFSLIRAPDWVNVIALTAERHVILVRQYRAGSAAVGVEIPGGMVDPGEAPQAAAARELVEETGYTAREWRRLGTSRPNPALFDNTLHSYMAIDCELTASLALDAGEALTVETRPLADVQAALRRGEIDHALVLAAFAHLALAQHELR